MHGLCKDLTGQRFGRLVVLDYFPKNNGKRNVYYCRCKCDCGCEIIVPAQSLHNGKRTNCGCDSIFHGIKNKRLKYTWQHMKQRCYNANNSHYKSYGGRGITVCDEWRNSFKNFYQWAISNGYSDELTIERIDVNKGYCPENCTWIPMRDQCKNKQNTIRYEINGTIKTAMELADENGIARDTLVARIEKYGFKPDEATTWKRNQKQYSKVKRRSRKYLYNGEMLTLREISALCGIKQSTLYERLHVYKWCEDRAFSEKVGGSDG